MNARDRRSRHDAHRSVDRAERELLAELTESRATPSPDLTRSIMGRLGYMQAAPRAAQRRHRRRAIGRALMTMAAALLVVAGLHIHEQGPDARRPAGPTIPSAIGQEIDAQQQRLQRAIQTIQNLAPSPSEPQQQPTDGEYYEEIDPDVDESGIGPVRWL
jgi:hypothetical protein